MYAYIIPQKKKKNKIITSGKLIKVLRNKIKIRSVNKKTNQIDLQVNLINLIND